MAMKTPTERAVDDWLRAIDARGYKRTKLRLLLRHFGAKRRGPTIVRSIDQYLESLTSEGVASPLRIDWGMAENLDDNIRIVRADTASGGESPERDEHTVQAVASLSKKEEATPSASVPLVRENPQLEIKRAISIRQPFVEAILDGKKRIEYRSRKTNIRERVYIYASLKEQDDDVFDEFGYRKEDCPRGVIVGTVDIVDCTGVEGDYEIHLANPQRLDAFLKPKNQPQPMFWRPQF